MHKRLTIAGIVALLALAATDVKAQPMESVAEQAQRVIGEITGDTCIPASIDINTTDGAYWVECVDWPVVYVIEADGNLYEFDNIEHALEAYNLIEY